MTAPSQPVRLRTAAGCSLAIGAYPRFHYDARGGGGDGLLLASDPHGRCRLQFGLEQLSIPPLNWRTSRLGGLPLLPGMRCASCRGAWRAGWSPPPERCSCTSRPTSCSGPAGSMRPRPCGWTPCSPVQRPRRPCPAAGGSRRGRPAGRMVPSGWWAWPLWPPRATAGSTVSSACPVRPWPSCAAPSPGRGEQVHQPQTRQPLARQLRATVRLAG